MKSNEIKLFLESLSRQTNISEESIAGSLAEALQQVVMKSMSFSPDSEIEVNIDHKDGSMEVSRIWYIVEDDKVEEPETQMPLTEALKLTDQASVGQQLSVELPGEKLGLGRIAAQQAKQLINKIIRDGQTLKQRELFKERINEVVTCKVKKTGRDFILVELSEHADGILNKSDIIPREVFRVDDKIKAEISSVDTDQKGAIAQLSRTSNNFLLQQFLSEVPEIHEGSIEIKAIARDPGSRAKMAVKSNDKRIDPIGACIGMRGARVQAVSNELNGERIDIILWDDDPAKIVINALSPGEIESITINEESKSMDIAVSHEQLAQIIGRNGQNIRLASELSGWALNIIRSDEIAAEEKSSEQILAAQLDVDLEIAEILNREGFTTVSDILEKSEQDLTSIEEFDSDIAGAIYERAKSASLELAFSQEDPAPSQENNEEDTYDMCNLEGITPEYKKSLEEQNIKTQDDIAELAVDELIEIIPIDKELAAAIIMQAREPWFNEKD